MGAQVVECWHGFESHSEPFLPWVPLTFALHFILLIHGIYIKKLYVLAIFIIYYTSSVVSLMVSETVSFSLRLIPSVDRICFCSSSPTYSAPYNSSVAALPRSDAK